jgi:hypothetical protein
MPPAPRTRTPCRWPTVMPAKSPRNGSSFTRNERPNFLLPLFFLCSLHSKKDYWTSLSLIPVSFRQTQLPRCGALSIPFVLNPASVRPSFRPSVLSFSLSNPICCFFLPFQFRRTQFPEKAFPLPRLFLFPYIFLYICSFSPSIFILPLW